MKGTRKIFSFIAVVLLVCGTVALSRPFGKKPVEKNDRLKIIASTYPIYDWIRNIVQDKCDVELLIASGTDLHSWQPGAKDIVMLTGPDTDLFVYNGGESDFWINKIAPQMRKNGVQLFSVMGSHIELLESVLEEHDHEEEDHCGIDIDEYDEHIWLSLMRVPAFISSITEKICSIDNGNADFYRSNAKAYSQKINDLYEQTLAVLKGSACSTIVVADRFPFVYLAKDFGLDCVAAFYGCSAETETSFDVVIKLTKVMNEKGLTKIAITETGNTRLAETIIKGCKGRSVEIKVLNALQGAVPEGATYLSIMEQNASVIKSLALN